MKIHYKPIYTTMVLLALAGTNGRAQQRDVNYDESKVSAYTLPALLTTEGGQPVTTVAAWEQHRRPELLNLFSSQMYGRTPARSEEHTSELQSRENLVCRLLLEKKKFRSDCC